MNRNQEKSKKCLRGFKKEDMKGNCKVQTRWTLKSVVVVSNPRCCHCQRQEDLHCSFKDRHRNNGKIKNVPSTLRATEEAFQIIRTTRTGTTGALRGDMACDMQTDMICLWRSHLARRRLQASKSALVAIWMASIRSKHRKKG